MEHRNLRGKVVGSAAWRLLGFGLMLFFAMGCLETVEYPPEPIITFNRYELLDSVDVLGNDVTYCSVYIDFTDGDGDLGLQPSDTIGPYHVDSLFHNNLLVDYYENHGNGMELIELSPSYSGRIPYLTPPGQNKQLKGTIRYLMDVSYRSSDTVQFDLRLVDRALNVSNLETTPIILIPQ